MPPAPVQEGVPQLNQIPQGGMVVSMGMHDDRGMHPDHHHYENPTSAAGHDTADHAWARWHGDWVPWNLARCHLGLVAWDWEYSEPGAPVGLDEVHGAYQQARVAEGRSIAEALRAAHHGAGWVADAHIAMLITRSAELERLLGAPPADQAELLAAARAAVTVP